MEGYSTGTFDEVWSIIRSQGCALNRQDVYGQALRDLYDYTESPSQVEEKGLKFLNNELSDYKRLVQEFADSYGCEARSEVVMHALREKKSLKINRIIGFINDVRKVIVKIVDKHVVGINPKYSTKVMETPRPIYPAFFPAAAPHHSTTSPQSLARSS